MHKETLIVNRDKNKTNRNNIKMGDAYTHIYAYLNTHTHAYANT